MHPALVVREPGFVVEVDEQNRTHKAREFKMEPRHASFYVGIDEDHAQVTSVQRMEGSPKLGAMPFYPTTPRGSQGPLPPLRVALLAAAGFVLAMGGCSPESESRAPTQASSSPAKVKTAWNVLVIVPDTVRGDHLAVNGYDFDTSPNLDALARDGINYRNAATVAPRTWQSFSSILTGLYPPHHGVRFLYDDPISPDTPMIASTLGENGYDTAAFDVIKFLQGMTGGRGFDSFHTSRGKKGHPDKVAASLVLEWVDQERRGPFFAFLRLSGSHWPYLNGRWAHEFYPCPGCRHRFNRGKSGVGRDKEKQGLKLFDAKSYRRLMWTLDPDEETLKHRIAHYDSEIRATDRVIGELLEAMRESGKLDRTIVVVTSDHGESFGEHGYLQHGPRVDYSVMGVPLIVWIPEGHPARSSGVQIDELVRVIDIFPTVLGLVGVEAPPGLDGRDLLAANGADATPSSWAYGEAGRSFMGADPERHYPGVEGKQRMLRTRDWKLVWTPHPDGGDLSLFNLRDDPNEQNDVAHAHPDRVAAMRAQLAMVTDSEIPQKDEKKLSPEEIEQLKRLGYMQ